MAKEVRIELTPAQKAKIKEATGKNVPEIRVSSLGKNIAVSPVQKDLRAQDLKAEDLKAEDLKAEDLKAEDLKAEDLKAEDLKAEDLKAEDLKAEDLSASSDAI